MAQMCATQMCATPVCANFMALPVAFGFELGAAAAFAVHFQGLEFQSIGRAC